MFCKVFGINVPFQPSTYPRSLNISVDVPDLVLQGEPGRTVVKEVKAIGPIIGTLGNLKCIWKK